MLGSDSKTGPQRVDVVDRKLPVGWQPDSFCATSHPLRTGQRLVAKVRDWSRFPRGTNAIGDGSAIRRALRSSTCARGIGIPADSSPRPGLVCRTPDVLRSAQTGLHRTRSFRHLRNRAHRRISPRPARTVPPPRTTASRRGNSREERVRLRYHLLPILPA
jgi:hypothetical protein